MALDVLKELGELSDRLVCRTLAFGLHEFLHERDTDPLVDIQRQSAQQVDGPAMSSDLLLVGQQAIHQLVALRPDLGALRLEVGVLRLDIGDLRLDALRLEVVVLRLDLRCGGRVLRCVVVHGSKVAREPAAGKGRAEPIAPARTRCALGEGGGRLSHEDAAARHGDLGRRDGSADASPRFGTESRSLFEANSGRSGCA